MQLYTVDGYKLTRYDSPLNHFTKMILQLQEEQRVERVCMRVCMCVCVVSLTSWQMRWMSCNYADRDMIVGGEEEEEEEKQGRACICPCISPCTCIFFFLIGIIV